MVKIIINKLINSSGKNKIRSLNLKKSQRTEVIYFGNFVIRPAAPKPFKVVARTFGRLNHDTKMC